MTTPGRRTKRTTRGSVALNQRPARFVVVLLTASLAVTACGQSSAPKLTAGSSSPAFHGVEPAPEPARPEFVLTDTSGQRYDFTAKTHGQPTYLFFGYTHCPDDCPTAMADLRVMLTKVTAAQRDRVRVVMVTTDPKRDTGPIIRQFLDQFSTAFVGLYGTSAQIAAAQTAAGVPVAQIGPDIPTIPGHPNEHVHKPGTAAHKHFGPLGYSVSHSSVILAYDVHDRLPVLYPIGVTPLDIAADLPLLLR